MCQHFAVTYWLKWAVSILKQKTAAPKARTSTCRSQGPQACLCFGLAKPHTAQLNAQSPPDHRLRATCMGKQLGPSRQTATWITDTGRDAHYGVTLDLGKGEQQQTVCRAHKSWLNCAPLVRNVHSHKWFWRLPTRVITLSFHQKQTKKKVWALIQALSHKEYLQNKQN